MSRERYSRQAGVCLIGRALAGEALIPTITLYFLLAAVTGIVLLILVELLVASHVALAVGASVIVSASIWVVILRWTAMDRQVSGNSLRLPATSSDLPILDAFRVSEPAYGKKVAEQMAGRIVDEWARACSAVAYLPGSQATAVFANVPVVMRVAAVFGITLDAGEAAKILISVTASAVGPWTYVGIAEFVPIVGWAVKGAVAAAVARKTGYALIQYFGERSRLHE